MQGKARRWLVVCCLLTREKRRKKPRSKVLFGFICQTPHSGTLCLMEINDWEVDSHVVLLGQPQHERRETSLSGKNIPLQQAYGRTLFFTSLHMISKFFPILWAEKLYIFIIYLIVWHLFTYNYLLLYSLYYIYLYNVWYYYLLLLVLFLSSLFLFAYYWKVLNILLCTNSHIFPSIWIDLL